jgi:signal transduction histidine kinase
MNLCFNARDAMPRGGRLQVRLEALAGGTDKKAWIKLLVRDTGHGMTESVRQRIFDPFFSTKELGTGLGLVIVQQIIESAGGRIEVQSQLDDGTCFAVWLPRFQENRESAELTDVEPPTTTARQNSGIQVAPEISRKATLRKR